MLQDLSIDLKLAEELTLAYYGIKGRAKSLAGEVDYNFCISSEQGDKYTLKISRPDVNTDELDFQAEIMNFLAKQELPFQLPVVLPTNAGKLRILFKDQAGQSRWVRLQKWVPGRVIGELKPRSFDLLKSWGQCCGHLSSALKEFDHPVAHRFYKWDPSETLYSRKYEDFITGKEEKAIATYFWKLFQKETLPQLTDLRKSVNYNDAHELNLLVAPDKTDEISGVIDFGDALYTHTINELAIACAYAGMEFPDPLQAVTLVIQGFHEVFPLEEKEVAVLYSLISARLMITVASAAWNKHQEPDNEYLVVSEKPAWNLLKKWRHISPALAHCTFRHACGWEACIQQNQFQNWIKNQAITFSSLVSFENKSWCSLDLGVGSLDLGNNDHFSTTEKFQSRIQEMLDDTGADIGIGGYSEIRPFYTTDAYQVEGNNGAQWRTVHLGLDIWAPDTTPVFAPLAGEVHSAVNNAGDCNYGPTLILRHQPTKDLCFYTLYGHLTADSIESLKAGDVIEKGQEIARIGPPPVNGNWPPHLHFQIILDMLDEVGDFPGVAYPAEQAVWLSICPDPVLMFPGLANKGTAISLKTEDILLSRSNHLGKGLSIAYQQPLHMVRGFGQYLYDSNARRYLDTVNNVAHVGHEHPRVVKAAQRQMGLLNTNTRYLHANIVQFAEELLATFPPELCVVHFVNSGSEANELALRMLRTCTGQKDIVAVEVGYHGNTGACIDVSSYKFDGKGGQGAPPSTHIVPLPDRFRGIHRDRNTAAADYAQYVDQAISNIKAEGRSVAGFIGESILSCGGQIVLPTGYLKAVYQAIRQAGGYCIADEVQVGFGRVGEAFWGFELQGVVPDIVTMGKPIGNGHPLAAVVTTREVADKFANGMEFFNTFGGNPVSSAIGREVLKVVQEENLQDNALQIGNYLSQGLKELQQKYPVIGDVRGPGLFLGFELIANPDTLVPAAAQASFLANRMRQRGVLMSTDGPDHNVIKIKPPMCFNQTNADFLLDNLDVVFAEDEMQI